MPEPLSDSLQSGACTHSVHFYRADPSMVDGLGAFVGSALGRGDACVVIATDTHREGLETCLLRRGIDLSQALRQGWYVPLNASDTLELFMRSGMPDEGLFNSILGDVIGRARATAPGEQAGVAAFGEMVALLWADGNREAALCVEELWNSLARSCQFSLRCAYPLALFARETDVDGLREVCSKHANVVPTEAYTLLSNDVERLRAVALLEQKALALESEVAERTRLLQAEQEARSTAEAALKIREEFLWIASHELRTPVATLKGSAQLLSRWHVRGYAEPHRVEKTLFVIERAADQLTALIGNLLDVARLKSGALPVEKRELDLCQVVTDWVEWAQNQFEETHLFSASLANPPCSVLADRERLDQVMANLLENAVKYSPQGGTVALSLDEAEGGWQLAVSDQGIGVPAGSEEHIFEPFGRASNALSSHIPGMGLGLHICREIVTAHGGRIWAESGLEDGTALVVWLPKSSAGLDSEARV